MNPAYSPARIQRSTDRPKNADHTAWATDDTGGACVTLWLVIGGIVAGVALALSMGAV